MGQQGDRRDVTGGGRMNQQVPLVYYKEDGTRVEMGFAEVNVDGTWTDIWGTVDPPKVKELIFKGVTVGYSAESAPEGSIHLDRDTGTVSTKGPDKWHAHGVFHNHHPDCVVHDEERGCCNKEGIPLEMYIRTRTSEPTQLLQSQIEVAIEVMKRLVETVRAIK